MKILVTGGGGFIGSTLIDRLLEPNYHDILVVDNFTTGKRNNLKNAENQIQIIEGSIGCTAFCSSVFQYFKPDIVVHAAASYKDPNNWHEDSITNVVGTINILNECKKHDIRQIIYFQTSLCYGLKPLEQPITLNHPLFSGKSQGGSSYAISKTSAEQYIELSGIPFFSFRLANAFGPRNLSGPLPTFYHRIKNNLPIVINNTKRDFIYIDDLIDVVEYAIDWGRDFEKGYYHISTGIDFSIEQLFNEIVKNLDVDYNHLDFIIKEPGEDDVATLLVDPSKTEKTFNWKAKTKFEEGVKTAIDWYKKNEITETFTHLKIK